MKTERNTTTQNTVEKFIKAFKKVFQKEQQIKKKLPKTNQAKNKIEALKDLSLREEIIIVITRLKIITGAVIIMDVEDYINETNQYLKNTDFRKEIPNNPKETKRKKINNIIYDLKSSRVSDEKITAKLEVQQTKTLEYLILPKVHKKENRRAPVIGGVNYRTSSIIARVLICNLTSNN